ncbi:MAG: glycosyltransferase [Brachybacterium sp.]|uniref:glycosyltransferase n=1 Tax=Brachybacterium sp. TaxID=1891286 RepID=UPI002648D3B9|nr:glycosyltransferase [Brachybacterium sp.]MDN5686078.1 glycosyltransferase [Brachybacterium sp.]
MTSRVESGVAGGAKNGALVIGLLTSVGGTVDAFFLEIIERWREKGAVVESAAGTLSEGITSPTVLPSVTRGPSLRNWDSRRELRAWVSEKKIDVVMTNTATASMLVRAAGVGVPVIYFCHGLHWNGRRLVDLPYRIVERSLVPRTDGIVCINSSDEEWFVRNASRVPRLRLLGGVGLDTTRFVRRAGLSWDEGKEPLRLAWCGEFSARKNPAAVVQLAHHLHRKGVDVVLDMLGSGTLFDSEDTRSSVEGLVRRRGSTDVVPYFEQAHVLVQTSRWEGLPRVGLEANAIGLPVVGFDVKGVRDLPSVQLAPPDDVERLAAEVLRAARGDAPGLPDPDSLSYVHAADSLLDFVESVRTGHFPRGVAYAR